MVEQNQTFLLFVWFCFLKNNTENFSQVLTLTTQKCLSHSNQYVTSHVGRYYFFFKKSFKPLYKYSSVMYGQFVIDGSEDAGYGAWGVPLFCTVYLKSH